MLSQHRQETSMTLGMTRKVPLVTQGIPSRTDVLQVSEGGVPSAGCGRGNCTLELPIPQCLQSFDGCSLRWECSRHQGEVVLPKFRDPVMI